MTQTSFPFEDEDTTETQFSRWARNIGEGVVPDANGDALTVTVGTGLAVDVDPGQCLVRGHYYTSTAVESLSLATADASDPRLDTVVLRLDPTANSVVLAVVVGSPAAVPTAPALTQTDAGVYELPLANVLVPANSGVPTTITDRRVFARRLGELSDVSVTSPASGEALVYDGTEWVNDSVAATLEDLTDTDISSPSSDEFLRYDGTDWVNTVADATTSTAGVVLGTTSDGTNTALGDGALESNTTGDQNTAFGYYALQSNTTGVQNTASGYLALQSNTTGRDNVASGYRALQSNTTGRDNVASGHNALRENTEGEKNVAVGHNASFSNTTGSDNTAVGMNAALDVTTGSNNASFGRSAYPSSATASNQVTLGNGNITSLRCNQTSISSLSDVRDKTDIETTTLGLDVINQVRPVEFTWARRDGTMGDTPDLGFIAQELAQVEDDLGETDRLRLTLRDNPEKLEASPNRLLPVLVKAVQELSAQNDELRARLDAVEGK